MLAAMRRASSRVSRFAADSQTSVRAQVFRLPALGPFQNVCQSFAFGFELQPFVHLRTEDVQLIQRQGLCQLSRLKFGFYGTPSFVLGHHSVPLALSS